MGFQIIRALTHVITISSQLCGAAVGFPRWAVWPRTVLPLIPISSHQKSLTSSSAGGTNSLAGEQDRGGNSRSIKLSSLESSGTVYQATGGAGALRDGKGDGEKAGEGSREGPGESWLPSMEVPTANAAG